ncbi:hypothetical protein SLS62_008729 [Diatrype stigma]|uniref:Protein kinase domain-containing protein n=1 Tax=Diatrype stigma TaxID=117547 RepID=A0AAN9UHA4_9PEZI
MGNIPFIVDTKTFEEKVQNVKDLYKYMGKPDLWPVRPIEGDDPGPYAPLNLVGPGFIDHAGFIGENKKVGLLGFEGMYKPKRFLSTPRGKHLSQFPLIRHPAQDVRGGAGATGFPSDIWSLACLFGEIRTESPFWRNPRDYGTPISMKEIKRYSKEPSERFGFWINTTKWEDIYYSSDYAESVEESDTSTSKETTVAIARDQTPPTGLDRLPEEPEEPKSKKKKTELHFERRITRSMTRKQEGDLSTRDQAQTREHDTVPKRRNPTKKSQESSRNSANGQDGGKSRTIGQVESKQEAAAENKPNKEKSTPGDQKADTTAAPNKNLQELGKSPDPSGVQSEEQALNESIITPETTSENTLKKEHRSDNILTYERAGSTHRYYEMPEDEQSTFADLLGKMLAPDPEDRLTIEEVLNHEWFGDRRGNLDPESK